MCKEIEKYLKAGGLPVSGKSADSKEETERRVAAWNQGRDFILRKWIAEERYAETVSVVHQGWVAHAGDFGNLLAEHFVGRGLLGWLRFFCERDIRLLIRDLLWVMKNAEGEITSWDEVFIIDVARRAVDDSTVTFDMNPAPSSHSVREAAKYRYLALRRLDRYIGYLERMNIDEAAAVCGDVQNLREKVESLTVRKKDLAVINFRLRKE
jgi:hypothetical protein